MKNSKKRGAFVLGRKIIFSLALFLLVFAAASAVKIQAAGNVTGWLWGGTEEISDGNPNNGLSGYETGVGWISMSSESCDINGNGTYQGATEGAPAGCPTSGTVIPYGVNIPSNTGAATGYAWMNAGGNPDNGAQNGIGWVDFNPYGDDGIMGNSDDHCTTGAPGAGQYRAASCTPPPEVGCSAGVQRNGNNLSECARIVSIAQATVAPSNSGGWDGWIKMRDASDRYQVKVSDMKGSAGTGNCANKNCAWSELGWIDFSRASMAITYSLSLSPNPLIIQRNPAKLYATITDSESHPVSGRVVTFTKTGSNKINLPATPSCTTDTNGECNIDLTATDFSTDATAEIAGTCAGGICSATSTVNIIRIPTCILSCPSEIIVSPNQQNKSVLSEIGVTGDPECVSSFITCSESGTDVNGNIDVSGSCEVSETGNLRYGSSKLQASAGSDTCTAPISVRGAGWVETTSP
jgi:hypothetical protein